MNQENFYIEQPGSSLPMTLLAVVCAQCRQNVPDDIESLISHKLIGGEYSLFRGIKGKGFICFGERSMELCADEIILLNTHEITAAVSNSSEWRFVQFRFLSEQPISFMEKNEKYTVPYKNDEDFYVKEMFCQQYSNAEYSGAFISTLFSSQMLKWAMELQTLTKEQNMYTQKIRFAIEYINLHLNEQLSISELSARFNISERHFRHIFRDVTGKSPKAYLQELRLTKAAQMLTDTEMTVQEISDAMGYYSQYQLSRDFKKFFSLSPTDYRKAPQSILYNIKTDTLLK